MRTSTNGQAPVTQTKGDDELRNRLEQETGTARRQELLKALWRLSQQREEMDSSVPETNAIGDSASRCQSKAKALESGSLSASC
jgi:hypothetical protein